MKTCAQSLLGLLTALVLSGCGGQDKPAKNDTSTASGTSSGNPITAPVDYLGAVAKAQKSAAKTLSAAGLDEAIKMYYGQEGKYPATLNDLVPDYLRSLPPAPQGMKYSYDPKTGTVKVVPL